MSRPDPLLPAGPGDEPVFAEPWHAQVFALAVSLHEQGRFAWPEFADELAATLRADPDGEYYASWLTALERVVVARGLMTARDLADREDAWHRAARATPHGLPITLEPTTDVLSSDDPGSGAPGSGDAVTARTGPPGS